LKTEPHPQPYKVAYVAWVDNTNWKIEERCLVTHKPGGLVNEVQCDVVPLRVCHILLGRPWLFD